MNCRVCGREILLTEAESKLGCCKDCFDRVKEEKSYITKKLPRKF